MDISADPATAFMIGVALAWLAGVRVYLTIFGVGLAAHMGWLELPASLQLAQSPIVLTFCGALALVEFFADKLPGADSIWDLVHTLVRIPAGAFLGTIALPGIGGDATLAGLALGGGVAALSHGLKSSTRALINASPEPLSNWTASFTEDALVISGLWLVFTHPLWAMLLLLLATSAFVAIVVLLFRLVRHVARQFRSAVA